MSQTNRNFDDCMPNINLSNPFCGNNVGCTNRQENLSNINPSGMFTHPPPSLFPNYNPVQLSFPPPPLPSQAISIPPPPPFPAQPISVPPPPIPFSNQSLIQNRLFPHSQPNCFDSKLDDFNQQRFPGPVQYRIDQFHTPLSRENFVPELNFQSQKLVNEPVKQDELMAKSDDVNNDCWKFNWLKSLGKYDLGKVDSTSVEVNSGSSSSEHKIYEVKEKVLSVSKVLYELENACKSLSVVYKSLSYDEWTSRCAEIEEKRKEVSCLLGFFANNKKFIQTIKQKLIKRKKKRKLQKRRREEWKQEKVEDSIRRQQLHQNIDRWLEDMKDAVEKGRREEELKREADCVLADVIRKKSDAKRQIALLSALLKLREARVNAQKAIGRNISQQQTDAFISVIERLKSLWMKQLREYSLEEQGLKVMLYEAAADEKNNQVLKKKEILRDWELAIFGDNKTSEFQPHNIDNFISVRKQWDQFVVEEGTVMSSSIPPGWVVPVKGSDSNWIKFNKI